MKLKSIEFDIHSLHGVRKVQAWGGVQGEVMTQVEGRVACCSIQNLTDARQAARDLIARAYSDKKACRGEAEKIARVLMMLAEN